MMLDADASHLAGLPADKREDLATLISLSPIRRACVVGGEVLGLYGVVGQTASLDGVVWFYLTDAGRRRKFFTVRTAIRELAGIAPLFRRLASGVDERRPSDRRFAAVVGFRETDEVEYAAGAPYRRVEMRGTL